MNECLHYSPTRLLQLTLCWPPSWAVTVNRQGPAHCRMPLSWVLLPLIFETSATLPWEFRVVTLSPQQSRVFFSSHSPTLQLCRITPSQLLAPRFGMGYLWRSDCSLGLSLTPFTLISKLSCLAILESGALLSSRLEGAL